MVFPIAALFAVIKVACVVCGAAFCTHKVTEAYNKNQKLKGLKYKDREAARQAALESNKKIDAEENEWKKKYEEQEEKNKETDKKIEEAQRKSKDPSLSEEERQEWKNKLVILLSQQEDNKNSTKNILNKLKNLEKERKQNNQIINSAGLTYDGDHGWVWEFLTLENILICLAIYAVWKIVRDENR